MSKQKLFRLSVQHDQSKHDVFVHWIDGVTSGTLRLTAEQAMSIGTVGRMALAAREEAENG
jgi:hypothetical protein